MSNDDLDDLDELDDVDGNIADEPDDELDDDELDDPNRIEDPNRVAGAGPRAVLSYLVERLVDEPDEIEIDVEEDRGRLELHVRVASDDMGRVIGRRGRTANAIRAVVGAAADRDGLRCDVEFDD